LVTRPAIVASFFLLLASLVPAGTVLAGKDEPQPIVVKEPHYGEVLFYFYQEDYFPAIVRLLAAQEQGKLEQHAAQADLLKGGLYLSYGHHLEAADIFERLLADNVNPEIRDRTWFFLAKIWRQRGYLDKAQRALDNIGEDLPEDVRREAKMLQAQLLIDGGEYDRAIALLQDWKGKTEWSRYAQFNLGVALVRSGRMDRPTWPSAMRCSSLDNLMPQNRCCSESGSRGPSRTRPCSAWAGPTPNSNGISGHSCRGWNYADGTSSIQRSRSPCWRFRMRWRSSIRSARPPIII
jgi:tetratricopeptide (TPR) repeat protein